MREGLYHRRLHRGVYRKTWRSSRLVAVTPVTCGETPLRRNRPDARRRLTECPFASIRPAPGCARRGATVDAGGESTGGWAPWVASRPERRSTRRLLKSGAKKTAPGAPFYLKWPELPTPRRHTSGPDLVEEPGGTSWCPALRGHARPRKDVLKDTPLLSLRIRKSYSRRRRMSGAIYQAPFIRNTHREQGVGSREP